MLEAISNAHKVAVQGYKHLDFWIEKNNAGEILFVLSLGL